MRKKMSRVDYKKKKKSFVKINSIVDQLETVRYTAGVYCVQLYSTMM